jgi:hypothetical protein
MVRYTVPDDDVFRRALVEYWTDDGQVTIRDVGRELSPGVRPGLSLTIEAAWHCARLLLSASDMSRSGTWLTCWE